MTDHSADFFSQKFRWIKNILGLAEFTAECEQLRLKYGWKKQTV